MGDEVPTGDTEARKLEPQEKQLLELVQQKTRRPQTYKAELPATHVESAKLKNQLLDLFGRLDQPPPFHPEGIGHELFNYLAEKLEKPGREFFKQFICPATTRLELEALPTKVLLPRKWATRDWSYKTIHEDIFKLTWNLVRVMDSDFRHIDAVKRAFFCAPGGISVLNGKSKTGKTTVAVLQALAAALCGHKVLITGSTKFDVDAISNRLLEMLRRMDTLAIRDNHNNPKLKVHLATWIWEDVPSTDDLLTELNRARTRASGRVNYRKKSPVVLLTNRVGPHSLFHQLAIDLNDESRRRTGAKDVKPGRAFPRGLDVPLIYDALTEYSVSKKLEALNTLHNGLYSTLEGVLARANIVVTSCLAARNIPFFEPTMVIVDQWNPDKDLECMIPLIAFDQTEFRSIIGDFDIPHWRRMWESNLPISLPIRFSAALDPHKPFTSMYTLQRRIFDDMTNTQSKKKPESKSLIPKSDAVRCPAHSIASGADLGHHSLEATFENFDNEPKIPRYAEPIKDFQVTKTEQTKKTRFDIPKDTGENYSAQFDDTEKTKATGIEVPETIEEPDDMQVAETEKTGKIETGITEAIDDESVQIAETGTDGDSEIVLFRPFDEAGNMQIPATEESKEAVMEKSKAAETVTEIEKSEIAATEDIQAVQTEKTTRAGIDYSDAYVGYYWYTDDMQVAEIEKTREADIEYCTAYKGYWYNE